MLQNGGIMEAQKVKHIYLPQEGHDIIKAASKTMGGAKIPYVALQLIKAGAKKICPEYFKVTPTQKEARK